MRTEAASAGFYVSGKETFATKYPRLQILTVGELLAGKRVEMPGWRDQRTFKAAPKVKGKSTVQPEMFDDKTQ
jgi:site-specific DNA-methyltransferase (adenine-specific)